MFKQTQYFAVDIAKPTANQASYERVSPNIVDNSRFRQRDVSIANLENCSDQRFKQIKRKYGIQDKLILEQTEIKPLREINLKTSNSYIFKDKQQNYKSRSATVSKSTLIYPSNVKQIPRHNIRQSIVRKVDQQKDIPRFGGKTNNWEGVTSKSIEIIRDQRLGSINKLTMKIHQALNLNIDHNKPKQQNLLKSEKTNPDIVSSKIYTQIEDNNINNPHEIQQSRRVQSIDDKMRRFSANFSALQQNKRSRTPHLLEQSKKQDSFRHRNFDDEIRRIEQRIKKSNEQKKRLDIILPQRQNIQLPKRVLDYTKQQQKSLTFMERRNRIMSNHLSSMKLKTQECQNPIDLPQIKQSNRVNTEYSKFELSNQRYDDYKYQNYEKQNTTHRSFDEKTELNKLVEALKIQVQLDEKLRNAKVASSSNHVQNKWNFIKQALQKQKIFFSEAKVQSQFEISQQEHNPFFSVRESNKSFDEVIKKYSQSYKHWTTNIFQKFNLVNLTKQGFCEKNIDLTKKGQISIQDLVRFLNFQTKNFYRNRDVFLIWRRITTKSSLQFEELTNNICHK